MFVRILQFLFSIMRRIGHNSLMKSYLALLSHVLNQGIDRTDRTGVGTRSIFGYQMRFDLQAGFPLLTTKKLHLRSIIYELLWFLKGDTNIAWLKEHGVSIWDEWADKREILVLFMVISGVLGLLLMDAILIKLIIF